MSVLIKGVEMPKNCFECPCVILDDRVCQVNLTFEDIAQYTNKRPDWCPLVEIAQCKDCVHYDGRYCITPSKAIPRHEDWWCADGEREVEE